MRDYFVFLIWILLSPLLAGCAGEGAVEKDPAVNPTEIAESGGGFKNSDPAAGAVQEEAIPANRIQSSSAIVEVHESIARSVFDRQVVISEGEAACKSTRINEPFDKSDKQLVYRSTQAEFFGDSEGSLVCDLSGEIGSCYFANDESAYAVFETYYIRLEPQPADHSLVIHISDYDFICREIRRI